MPNKDIYVDKDGKVTDDPEKYAIQVAAAGVNLDERIAKRYGIEDSLVSVDEPAAPRRVTGRSESSVHIKRAEKQEAESEPTDEPDAEAAEPKAKKGAKKK